MHNRMWPPLPLRTTFSSSAWTISRRAAVAFLNCTREFLVRDYAALLPKDRVVIEVLETVRIDDELIAACQRLKHGGYQIALDDSPSTPEWQPLVELADFIKVDVLATRREVQLQLTRKFARSGVG